MSIVAVNTCCARRGGQIAPGLLILAVIAFISAVQTPAFAAAAKDTCSATQKQNADRQLDLTADAKAGSLKAIFPWGPPKPTTAHPGEQILVQADYAIDYDADLFGPIWSADVLGVRILTGGRLDCFRADPRLPAAMASAPPDFDEPIFDQGHMVSNADMAFAQAPIVNSFLMSNMSPQFCQFNRGIWQILETLARQWSNSEKPLYVVSGAIFDRDGDGQRDLDSAAVRMQSRNHTHRVAVPSAYYKILAFQSGAGALETLTLVLPHDQTNVPASGAMAFLQAHVSSIGAVEAVTGLQFFPGYADQRVERSQLWDPKGAPIQSLVYAPCLQTNGAHIVDGSPKVYALP